MFSSRYTAFVNLRLILRQGLIFVYLLLTLSAFCYTLSRWPIFLRLPLTSIAYSMMAPYQSYTVRNIDLLAEGQLPDGTWHKIDLTPYFPFDSGETMDRKYLFTFRWRGSDAHLAAYHSLASQVLAHEQENGKPYKALRLSWQSWPASPAGYDALRLSAFTETISLAIVP